MNTFSCSLPYGMHSNPLPNAPFWAVCLQSWWQADLMETLKWLPLDPRSAIGSVRHTNPDPIMWNTQSDQSADLPPRLSARNHAAGAEPGTGCRCVRAQTVRSTWELCWELLLCRAGATERCRRSSLRATATDTVQGIHLIRWNGFAMRDTLERRPLFMEVLLESTSHFLGVLLIWGLFWWERFTSTASPLSPK